MQHALLVQLQLERDRGRPLARQQHPSLLPQRLDGARRAHEQVAFRSQLALRFARGRLIGRGALLLLHQPLVDLLQFLERLGFHAQVSRMTRTASCG